MRATIKGIYSPSVPDLASYLPEDPENFSFLLQLMVGPADSDGEESFDVEVCTPKWLLQKYKKDDVLICRHRLIVFEYDFERIMAVISRFVENCTGETWRQVAQKVSRLGQWEFEDYIDYSD